MIRILKNISLLFSFNLIGSLINFLTAPLITRFYSPENFGNLALFLSMSLLGGMIVTLKWENILFIEANISTAIFKLTSISIFLSSLLIVLVLIFLWMNNLYIIDGYFILYLITYIILLGFYYFARSYHSSLGNYKLISLSFLVKIIVSNFIFLIFGYLWGNFYFFLILGTIIGQFSETSILLFNFNWKDFSLITNFNELLILAKKYKKFPLFTLPGELVGNINSQLPIFVLSNSFGATTTGYFSLIQRIFGIPLKLFTSSTAEVFRREAAIRWKENKNFKRLALKTSFYLFLIGLFPAIILFFFAEKIIPLFFGSQWTGAVPYLQAMIFLFILQFSVSPISYGLYISEKQEIDFIWQVILLFLCSVCMLVSLSFNDSFYTIITYVSSYALMYIVYFLIILRHSKLNVK